MTRTIGSQELKNSVSRHHPRMVKRYNAYKRPGATLSGSHQGDPAWTAGRASLPWNAPAFLCARLCRTRPRDCRPCWWQGGPVLGRPGPVHYIWSTGVHVSVPDNAWQVVATDEPYPPGPTNYFLYLDILTQPHSGGLAGMTSGTISSATVGAPKAQRTDRGGELNAD